MPLHIVQHVSRSVVCIFFLHRWLQESFWSSLMIITRSWGRMWVGCRGVFTAGWSDTFLHHNVLRSKNAPQLFVILKSNLVRFAGIWKLHNWIGNILCSLCKKRWHRLCVLMRTENWCLSYTHLPSNQSSKAPRWPGMEPERGRKECQYFECNKWDHFYSTEHPRWCPQCEQVNFEPLPLGHRIRQVHVN